MMKTKTTATRRVLALFMSVLMLMTAWVFVAPTASAVETQYKWRVRIVSENATGGWNDEEFRAYGCKQNGTASQTAP